MPLPDPPQLQMFDPHLRKVVLIIGYMIIIAGAAYALSVAWPVIDSIISVLLPFLVALIVAYILNPIVTFLCEQLRLGKIAGLGVFYLMVLIVLATFVGMVLPILISQVKAAYVGITQTVPGKLESWLLSHDMRWEDIVPAVQEFLLSRGINLEELLANTSGLKDTATTAATSGLGIVSAILKFVLLAVAKIIGSVTFVVFVILISCYFILDFAKFRGVMEIIIPDPWEPKVFSILHKCDVAVGGYLRGQLISAFLVGVLVFTGLMFLGLGKFALLIAMIATIGNLIPYLGPVLAGAPAVLYQLFNDDYETFQQRMLWTGGTALMFIIVQQIDGFVFQPKIVGKGAQLHPVVVLLALIAGAKFGIMGMIVAVPIASIARVLLKEFYWDEREKEWNRTTGKHRLDDPERKPGGGKRQRAAGT